MILETLNADLYKAIKEKDLFKVGALRYLLAQVKNKEIELRAGGQGLSDEAVLNVIKKQIKQRNQSIEGYQMANRPEAVEKEKKELEMLENYFSKFSS